MNILNKIKQAGLVGRGGACFPTAEKWQMVKEAKGEKKYVVCNASEGEPGVSKDGYILENFGDRVIDGIKIAIDFLSAEKAYIYINHKYHKKYASKLIDLIWKNPIELFIKPIGSGYIGGEETSILNAIEGRRIEPRLRPPFPPTNGLWEYPTLINNVETLYNVSLVAKGEFKNKRFYTINGDCMNNGVYDLADSLTIEKILKETENYPKFPFFVQVGGNGSGEILNSKQLKTPAIGAGSITVYSIIKNKPKDLIKNWLNFFLEESCGQCVPCREGVYRLTEVINNPNPDWKIISDLLTNLDDTAFCGLGCVVPVPIRSFIKNVLPEWAENKINLPKNSKKVICECFK
ncbi:MAG: NADH-ubiquinone oxidoreductase-F iron-sulfur binding region domain-containing protein [Patescibacteria group bacterium]